MKMELFNPYANPIIRKQMVDSSYIVLKTHIIYQNGKHITTRKIWHNNINQKKVPFYFRLFYSVFERFVELFDLNYYDSIIEITDSIYEKLPNNILDI